MKKIIRCLTVFALSVFVLLPLSRAHADTAVSVVDFAYTPGVITIPAGTTVVWKNTGAASHTVTADNGSFDSGTIAAGGQYSHTFTTPGTYTYHCNFHPTMHGTVVVSAARAQTASAQNTSQAAVNVNDLISQTQSLIQQINRLQAQQGGGAASNGGGASSAAASSAANNTARAASGACPSLSRTLSIGASGNDVSSLQQFLAQDPGVYPERLVTGYFGALTQAAVRRWQVKNGIVSSGTPSSTGYGMAGPRTRASIMAACGAGAQSGPAVASGFISLTPATGNAPLTTNVTATVNTTNSCAGTPYIIDFGDGPDTRQFISTAGNCSQQSQTFTHTYTSGGVYTVTLAAGGHQTTATVTVNGSGAQTGTVDSIHPSSASGTVPFLVTFTGTVSATDAGACVSNCTDLINFGDGGSVSVPLPERQQGYQTYTTYIISHTYTRPGAYIATLTSSTSSSPGGQVRTFANTQITVSGNPVVVVPPSLSITAGVSYIAQGGLLPITWQSQHTASSSAVGLWLINVQSGAIYPLAMTLNTTGNLNAPIPATAADGIVPPVGPYEVLGKIYTPADAILTGTPPTYVALAQSGTFNILLGSGAASTPTTTAPVLNSGVYQILSVATGVGGNQALVNMQISYPACSGYSVDWGDGNPLQNGTGGTSGCGAQSTVLLNHTYQQNGTMTIRLLNAGGAQQATAVVSISNAGTTVSYGMTSVTSGIAGNPLNVTAVISVPPCPSFSLDWGDSTSLSQTAAAGCAGGSAAVSIVDFAYSPSSITIPAGTTVVWNNTGAASHTVTADNGSFDSGTIAAGGQYSRTFTTPGTYTYHCTIHPSMHGTVTVTGTGRQSLSFNHTYAQDGTYVIKLNDGAGALQSSSSIHLTQ